jgi:hypothetical protein
MINIISSTKTTNLNDIEVINQINTILNDSGWVLLRGFNGSLQKFSELLKQFCSELTFDPAREYADKFSQRVNCLTKVTEKHLADFIAINKHQRGKINADDSLDYELDIQPCLPIKSLSIKKDDQAKRFAFANAILGPSYNYEKPHYTFPNGEPLSEELIKKTIELTKKYTHEIHWQDGDIAIINNKRVLHGRRAIIGNLTQRKLFIGMGY